MTRQESGYATITITAILLGLSIIAVAVLNHASASAQKSQKISERILLDAAIEGTFQTIVRDLINRDLAFSGASATLTKSSMNDVTIYVVLSSESGKIDINRDPIEVIDQALSLIIDDRTTQQRLVDLIKTTRSKGTLFQSISDLLEDESNLGLAPCLRDKFTVFRRNAISASRSNQSRSLDGQLLRIRAESRQNDSLNRGVDGVVLFTGDRSDPAWTMDWRRYTAPEMEACK